MSKKIFLPVLLCAIMILSSLGTAFADTTSLGNIAPKNTFNITIEQYESVLPFKLNPADRTIVAKLLDEIRVAFDKNDLTLAQKKIDEFYTVVGKYWTSESTLKVLLPFDDMMKFGIELLSDDEKKSLKADYAKLAQLRKENKFEEYFKTIKGIFNKYYSLLGNAIGDANGELQLIQYIKGSDNITAKELVNYSFEDYLHILPFQIKDEDFVKGKKIFDSIVEALKKNEIEKSKKLTKDLNGILAPYWISNDTLNLIVPHEKYKTEMFQYFTKKNQLELNKLYEEIKVAQEKADFDKYFATINAYFKLIGFSIQEFYNDYFDEIVFIRS